MLKADKCFSNQKQDTIQDVIQMVSQKACSTFGTMKTNDLPCRQQRGLRFKIYMRMTGPFVKP